jgi:hypothetical protein
MPRCGLPERHGCLRLDFELDQRNKLLARYRRSAELPGDGPRLCRQILEGEELTEF